MSGLASGLPLVAVLTNRLKVIVFIRAALRLRNDVVTHAMVRTVQRHQLGDAVLFADLTLEAITLKDAFSDGSPFVAASALSPALLRYLMFTAVTLYGLVPGGPRGH